MDHDEAVRQKMTERYLLGELDSEVKDSFEDHLFDCQECATDVRAGATFVEHSKTILSESRMTAPSRAPRTEQEVSRWFGWLRPAFSVPAYALLLAVVAYQGWTNFQLRQSANSVQFLASAVVNLDVRAGEPIRVPVSTGHPFELSVNLPLEAHYSAYKLNLYNQSGGLEWSRTVQVADSGTLSLYVPGNGPAPGALAVQGITAAGGSVDLGRFRIEMQD